MQRKNGVSQLREPTCGRERRVTSYGDGMLSEHRDYVMATDVQHFDVSFIFIFVVFHCINAYSGSFI